MKMNVVQVLIVVYLVTVVWLVRKISNANPGNGMCQTTNVLRLDAKLVSSMTNPYLSLTPKGPKVGLV